jgi:hypothetical protein
MEHPKVFTQAGSGLTCEPKTRLERSASNKHSSLLQKFINYGCKKFIIVGPGLIFAGKSLIAFFISMIKTRPALRWFIQFVNGVLFNKTRQCELINDFSPKIRN